MKVYGIIVEWYETNKDQEHTTYLLTFGNSFTDIVSEIESSYPCISKIKLVDMFTSDRYIEVSKAQFDSFYENGWLE